MIEKCSLCPNMCLVNREKEKGICGLNNEIRLSKAMLHKYEEPVISGKNGTGALFFSGCTLSCVYCQNKEISHNPKSGKIVSVRELEKIIFNLIDAGAETLSLITCGQYLYSLAPLLKSIKHKIKVPVVYNTGGYENVESIEMLNGIVDVYLPDFKYFDDGLAFKYSRAYNYNSTVTKGINAMLKQTGKIKIENGITKKGTIIRHLILPSLYRDSEKIIKYVAENYSGIALFSLMRQYTPAFCDKKYTELNRIVTSYEYNYLLNLCSTLGLEGFSQGKESATEFFTPNFKE